MAFWNKKIINFEDQFFGLDLSDLSVKVFQLEKSGKFDRIRSFNSKDIKPGCIENGRIINREKVSRIIAEIIKTAGPKKINTKKVICSIPESKVFLRTISIPKINENEAQEAIKWEIEASIPLSVDQVYFDWQFLDQVENKQNVLTVAVAKETIDDLIATLEDAGLSVWGLEMESIATARSLIPKNSQNGDIFLIIDMGAEKTSFIITENNVPYFTSSLPFSSSGITDVIASQMNVAVEEAEKIKTTQGIEHSLENDSVFKLIYPFLENLSVEVEKTIDFYHNMFKNPKEINKIIISGGGANLKGVVPYFATRLSREVTLGLPWINLNLGKNLPPISMNDSARYATAVGLAMRGINYGNKT
jgi:type IV pilus assembly protein PilM